MKDCLLSRRIQVYLDFSILSCCSIRLWLFEGKRNPMGCFRVAHTFATFFHRVRSERQR